MRYGMIYSKKQAVKVILKECFYVNNIKQNENK